MVYSLKKFMWFSHVWDVRNFVWYKYNLARDIYKSSDLEQSKIWIDMVSQEILDDHGFYLLSNESEKWLKRNHSKHNRIIMNEIDLFFN